MAITDPIAKDPYEIQRQRVDTQMNRTIEAKKKAVERQLSNKGISDSGIALGQQRTAEVDTRLGAAQERNQINTNEGLSEENRRESAVNRALQEKLATQSDATARRGQDISKDLGQQGINIQERGASLNEKSQADSIELARAGMGMQQAQLQLQEKGMDQQQAQYYAGLGQAKYLAEKGMTLQEQAQELTKQGMSQEDARYYSGLAQAKTLADQGLTLQQQAQELQRQGMTLQDAQYYAGFRQGVRLI